VGFGAGLGPKRRRDRQKQREIGRIPSADAGRPMLTTVFRPPGEQRQSMLVLNHGIAEQRALSHCREALSRAASACCEEGYVVVLPGAEAMARGPRARNESFGSLRGQAISRAGLGGGQGLMPRCSICDAAFRGARQTLIVASGTEAGPRWHTRARNRQACRPWVNIRRRPRRAQTETLPNNNCAPRNMVDAAGKSATPRACRPWGTIHPETKRYSSRA